METLNRTVQVLLKLRAEGRIAPESRLTCRGLESGIKVDGTWTPLERLCALVDSATEPASPKSALQGANPATAGLNPPSPAVQSQRR